MAKILSYKKFADLNEGFPRAYSDPMYGSDVFRVRYRQINDLSNKKGSDVKPKPINDLLDQFQVGDIVRGKCVDDGSYYTGKIINIGKDEEGENTEVHIEHDGRRLRLAPSTVTFTEGGDVGNRRQKPIGTPDQDQLDLTQSNTFVPTTYESENK